MKNLIGYAPALIAFLAMFVGLLGPGRSADKTGLRAITPFGWTSCAIAAASLCVAVYVQRTKNAELATALASKQQMQTAVFRETAGVARFDAGRSLPRGADALHDKRRDGGRCAGEVALQGIRGVAEGMGYRLALGGDDPRP